MPCGARPPCGFQDQPNWRCGGLAPPRALSPSAGLQIRLHVAEPAGGVRPEAGCRVESDQTPCPNTAPDSIGFQSSGHEISNRRKRFGTLWKGTAKLPAACLASQDGMSALEPGDGESTADRELATLRRAGSVSSPLPLRRTTTDRSSQDLPQGREAPPGVWKPSREGVTSTPGRNYNGKCTREAG